MDLKITALGVLFQSKYRLGNCSGNFAIKEILSDFVSSLQEDDVGYYYDPKNPNDICTSPGELVGKIMNLKRDSSFSFMKGLVKTEKVLSSLDSGDYDKLAIFVTDCYEGFFPEFDPDIKVHFFGIGDFYDKSLRNIIHLEDISDLKDHLQRIIKNLP